jgi:hypothetical protein
MCPAKAWRHRHRTAAVVGGLLFCVEDRPGLLLLHDPGRVHLERHVGDTELPCHAGNLLSRIASMSR